MGNCPLREPFHPEEFEPILGYQPVVLTKQGTEKPLCPGQLFRHYSPKAKLYLGDLSKLDDSSVILGFKERSYPAAKQVLFLGSISDPQEVAENLYRTLRLIDQEGYPSAWVADGTFPGHGLWQTIAEPGPLAGGGLFSSAASLDRIIGNCPFIEGKDIGGGKLCFSTRRYHQCL